MRANIQTQAHEHTYHAMTGAFSLTLPDSVILACSCPGLEASAALRQALNRADVRAAVFDIAPIEIRAQLRGYGAWDEIELRDDAANRRRLVWLAACALRTAARHDVTHYTMCGAQG